MSASGPGAPELMTPSPPSALRGHRHRRLGPYVARMPERAGRGVTPPTTARRWRARARRSISPPKAAGCRGLLRRSGRLRHGGGGVRGDRDGRAEMARIDVPSCPASPRCSRRRPVSARRSAMISAPSRSPTISSLGTGLTAAGRPPRRTSSSRCTIRASKAGPGSLARRCRVKDPACGTTPVVFAHAVSQADERIDITTLREADPGAPTCAR